MPLCRFVACAALMACALLSSPAARAADPAQAEAALRRVLSSGCHDGLADVSALVGSAAAPWAPTIVRLCGEVLQAPPPAGAVATAPGPAAPVVYDGRGALVVGFTLWGIWVGIATDVLFVIDDARGAILAPLLGLAGGLGISLVASGDHPVTNSQAWTIITGLEFGSLNGALWAGGLDLNAKTVVGSALAGGAVAGAVGALVASRKRPRAGDIEVVRSGLLWGTVSGFLAQGLFAPDANSEIYWRTAAVAMDVGFVAGLALAGTFDLSRSRVLLIDAGTLGGGLVTLGVTWLITAGPGVSGRGLLGATLGGMYAGMILTAYLTREMDRGGDVARATPAVPALFARDEHGRWSWGMPAPAPVADRFGQRIVGAMLPALGGTF